MSYLFYDYIHKIIHKIIHKYLRDLYNLYIPQLIQLVLNIRLTPILPSILVYLKPTQESDCELDQNTRIHSII